MIDSKVLKPTNCQTIEDNLKDLLNRCKDFNNMRIISSPRAVGDTVQEILEENMESCFPEGLIKEFNGSFARRAMADVAFMDTSDNYFVVDIKTHNKDTDFNMPNLTSVERLSRFYKDDRNYFIIVLAEYKLQGSRIVFDNVSFFPIEHLKWDCLTIGALGWGQIQISNARIVNVDRSQKRKDWMMHLCDVLNIFYPREIKKIQDRLDYFSEIRTFWESKQP